jgi:predicted FMN-binding regulatory protein PaiB
MRFYSVYEQSNRDKVLEFVKTRSSCRLLTAKGDDTPKLGIFNPVLDGESFILHLNRGDEQLADLKARPKALITFEDFLALIPSYWVDEQYGGAATAYYRYAEFDCDAEIADTRATLLSALQKLMRHYQPEGLYAELDPESETYRKSFDLLAIVTLTPRKTRTKWKVGQNRPIETRKKVIQELLRRGSPDDLRTVEQMQAWIQDEMKGELS